MTFDEDGSKSSKIRNGKHMEWWYFVPLILAVVMFLLVGTIFEKKIEQKIKNFISQHLSRESPEAMSTSSTANQANLPSSSKLESQAQKTGASSSATNQPILEESQDSAQEKPTAPSPQGKQSPIGPKEMQVLNTQVKTQNPTDAQDTQNVENVENDEADAEKTLSRSAVKIRSRHLAPEIH